MMKQIIQQLTKSTRVLLASHASPDGDAIGALLAMGISLDKVGCRVVLHNESPIPAVYRFLPAVERIRKTVAELNRFDTAVILDRTLQVYKTQQTVLQGNVRLPKSFIFIGHFLGRHIQLYNLPMDVNNDLEAHHTQHNPGIVREPLLHHLIHIPNG